MRKVSRSLVALLGLLLLGAGCRTAPNSGPPLPATETWRGVHVPVRNNQQLMALERELPQLAAAGMNVVVVEVNYNFDFKSHPELRLPEYITKAKAREFTAAARKLGIRVIPEFDCLGHQSWKGTTFPLLAKYPQLDETPGKFLNNQGIYCRSWCPQNPKVYQIVFSLIDEIADAFQAKMFHVGMDEVFIIGDKSCPRCHDQDPAKLFAECVNRLYEHITVERKMQMLMWGDRLLDARTMGGHMYEESMNGTWPAVDMIPKDIIICDWHYDYHTNYPSVPFFLSKGFRVWPSGFQPLAATKAFSDFSLRQRAHNQNVIGYLCTTWSVALTNGDLGTWPPITRILPDWIGK
jgi:Glycosyl hydrolase family 20, catalytic domain